MFSSRPASTVRTSSSALFAVAVVATLAHTGCPGCQPIEADAGPGPDPILAFSTPRDGFVLNDADDEDGDTSNGIQFDVRVRYTGDEGTSLTLSSDQGESATATTEAGFATFVDFTFAASPAGIVNVLTVTDGDVTESISVTGRNVVPAVVCTFTTPTDGAVLPASTDANVADGFQLNVVVECDGFGVTPGLTVELDAGGESVTRTLSAALDASAQLTTANAVGANTLTATLFGADDAILDETSIDITISSAANVCSITSPLADAVLTDDADAVAGGFQIDVAVSCAGPDVVAGLDVVVTAGAGSVTATLAGAGPAFTANTLVTAFGEGANTITATLEGDLATASVDVTVDAAIAPFCAFVTPGPGAPVTADLDVAPGIQFEATVLCSDVAAGTTVVVTGGTADVSGELDAVGLATVVVNVLTEGEFTLTATVGVLVATTTFTVDLPSPCDVTITAPDDGTVFDALSVDADPGTPEFDVDVTLTTDPVCAGAVGRVSTGALAFEATVAVDGVATVRATLPDGVHVLTAEVESVDGIGGQDSITVTVDRTAADIVVVSPSVGEVYGPADDLDNDPANGISIPFSGTVTGATSASHTLTCSAGEVASGPLTLDGAGAFSGTFADLPVGACSLVVTADDGVNQAVVTVDFTVANVSVDVVLGGGLDQAPLGAFIASEDKDPGTAATVEIDLDVTATFDEGTYTANYTVVLVSSGATVASGDLGALTSGVASTVELSFPAGEETAYRVDVVLTPDAGPTVTASEPFVVDTVVPTLAWNSPVNGDVMNATTDQAASPGFQGFFALETTGHLGRIVQLQFAGAATLTATCTVAGGNEFCIQNVTLTDGAYSVTATASDPAGNVATPVVSTFTVDATLPLVQSVVVAADTVDASGAPGADGALSRAENGGNAAPATSSVTVTFAAGAAIESGRNVTLQVSPGANYVAASNGTSATFANVVLAEGTLSLNVTGTDAALNPTSPSGQPRAFRVDTTLPTIAIVSPTGTAITALPTTVVAATNAEAGRTATLTDVTGGGSVVLATATVGSGSATFTGVTLPQGSRTLRASVTDLVGNPAQADRTYLVDTEPPQLSLSLVSDPAIDADGALAGWQVTFSVAHTGLEAGRIIRLFSNLTGQRGQAAASATGTTTITGTFTTSAVHSMTAQATDLAGSTGVSNAVPVDIVTGDYDVFVESPLEFDGALLFSGLDVTGGVARLVITVPGLGVAATTTLALDGVTFGGATVSRLGDTITIEFPVAEGDTGSIEAVVDDGVMTGTTGVFAFVVDAVAPTVAFAAGTETVYGIAADVTAAVAGLQTTVVVDVSECESGALEVVEGGTRIGGPVDVGPSGAGSFDVEIDDPTEHVSVAWTARCVDLAGNEGTDALSTTVDLTAPNAPSVIAAVVDAKRGVVDLDVTAPGDDGASGANVVLDVVASRAALSLATFAAASTTPVLPGTGGLLSSSSSTAAGGVLGVTTGGLAYDTTWNFSVRATDAVGNESLGAATASLPLSALSLAGGEDGIGCPDDAFPSTSSLAADFDGDGVDDLIVAAPGAGELPVEVCLIGLGEGRIDLWDGRADLAALDVGTPARTITLAGQAFALGLFIGTADLDGDGRADLVAYAEDQNFPYAQHIVVAYGTDTQTAGVKDLLEAPRFVFVGGGSPSFDVYFESIRGIGDVNGDGFGDMWLGPAQYASETERERGRILFGSATRIADGASFSTLPHAILTSTVVAVTRLGVAAPLGNIDGDTNGGNPLDDFIVDVTNGQNHVVRGRATWPVPPATLDLFTLPATDKLTCTGAQCGLELSSADVNGDGRLDVLAIQPTTNSLLVHLHNGTTGYPTTASYRLAPAGGLLSGKLGHIGVGDTNDDGFDDVLFASYNGGGAVVPAVRVFLGGPYVEGAGLTGGVRVEADVSYDLPQTSAEPAALSACGDLDGDGTDDLCYGTSVGEGVIHVRF